MQPLSAKITLLNKELITRYLFNHNFYEFNLEVFKTIHSTNEFLKQHSYDKLAICCAEEQTNGRGRFSRVWQSPFGENIYLSLKYTLPKSLRNLSALSLVVSLSVLHTLQEQGINNISIKWPNDLVVQHKKLCGCLIELLKNNNKNYEIIIGVGLNVNKQYEEQNWTSLFAITNRLFDRNKLISQLILNINNYLNKFLLSGFETFQTKWKENDFLYNKEIRIKKLQQILIGKALGVNDNGELILMLLDGTKVFLNSGEASLHNL